MRSKAFLKRIILVASGWKTTAVWVVSSSSKTSGRLALPSKMGSCPIAITCSRTVMRLEAGTCSEKESKAGSVPAAAAGAGTDPRSVTSNEQAPLVAP